MNEITNTPSITAADFAVRPVGSTPIRLSTGDWLPNRSVRKVFVPASQEVLKDDDYYVPAIDWQRTNGYLKTTQRTREDAIDFLREKFNSAGGSKPWFEEITLQLSEANKIIEILQGEVMVQERRYNFNFTVTYEVTGTVTAPDEEQAERAIERLAEDMDDPDYSEPHLDGIDWDYVDVSHYETGSIGLDED